MHYDKCTTVYMTTTVYMSSCIGLTCRHFSQTTRYFSESLKRERGGKRGERGMREREGMRGEEGRDGMKGEGEK